MNMMESILPELTHEGATTKKILTRVPDASLAWKPHEKSRTLGELAMHIANIPGLFLVPLEREEFNRAEYKPMGDGNSVVETFDRNLANALTVLKTLPDERLLAPWTYKFGETVVFSMSRLAVIRAMGINHMIHHRGQLSVYLRLLNVPVPPAYGPTADES